MYNMLLHDPSLFSFEFRVYRIFLEIDWRAMNCR